MAGVAGTAAAGGLPGLGSGGDKPLDEGGGKEGLIQRGYYGPEDVPFGGQGPDPDLEGREHAALVGGVWSDGYSESPEFGSDLSVGMSEHYHHRVEAGGNERVRRGADERPAGAVRVGEEGLGAAHSASTRRRRGGCRRRWWEANRLGKWGEGPRGGRERAASVFRSCCCRALRRRWHCALHTLLGVRCLSARGERVGPAGRHARLETRETPDPRSSALRLSGLLRWRRCVAHYPSAGAAAAAAPAHRHRAVLSPHRDPRRGAGRAVGRLRQLRRRHYRQPRRRMDLVGSACGCNRRGRFRRRRRYRYGGGDRRLRGLRGGTGFPGGGSEPEERNGSPGTISAAPRCTSSMRSRATGRTAIATGSGKSNAPSRPSRTGCRKRSGNVCGWTPTTDGWMFRSCASRSPIRRVTARRGAPLTTFCARRTGWKSPETRFSPSSTRVRWRGSAAAPGSLAAVEPSMSGDAAIRNSARTRRRSPPTSWRWSTSFFTCSAPCRVVAPNLGVSAHVNDEPNDLMYAGDVGGERAVRDDSTVVDVGRNDYYGHGRSDCLDVSGSRFLEPATGFAAGSRSVDVRMPTGEWPLRCEVEH